MKNNEFSLQTESTEINQLNTHTSQLSSIKQAIQKVKCPGNNKVLFFCCYQTCENHPVMCGIAQCQCKKNHIDCFQYFQPSSYQKIISLKIQQQNQLKDHIENIFNNIVDSLYHVKSELINSLKNLFLKPEQQNFTNILIKSKFNQIKSKDLTNLIPSLLNKHQKQNQSLKDQLMNILQSSQNFLNQIKANKTHEINLFDDYFLSTMDKSFILTQEHQIFTLKSFMPKGNFNKLKLLYRASQHNFSTQMFYKNCNVQNTLILIKTQKDKIIGGYTPIPWKTYNQSTQQCDPSGQTFIFSLTNKHKLVMKDSTKATYFMDLRGPRFGQLQCGDLGIGQKCNIQTKGNLLFYKMNFHHQKYDDNVESYRSFAGTQNQTFLAHQWEVFQVIF